MSKKSKLHELIAVEADLTNTAKAILSETNTTFTKKGDHFMGITRTVTYFDEGRSAENETETKKMVTTVRAKIDHTVKPLVRLYDALLQKEEANQRAVADLVVDGVTIGTNLPATFLLGLETRLKAVRETLALMPTLQPGVDWKKHDTAGAGVYVSPKVLSKRTEKTVNHKVLYEATKEHPAQIEKWSEDVPVASIETIHETGMLTPLEKADILDRVDRLSRAVKKARQRANSVEVEDLHVGQNMVAYILGD